jgi:hypothetical protein
MQDIKRARNDNKHLDAIPTAREGIFRKHSQRITANNYNKLPQIIITKHRK